MVSSGLLLRTRFHVRLLILDEIGGLRCQWKLVESEQAKGVSLSSGLDRSLENGESDRQQKSSDLFLFRAIVFRRQRRICSKEADAEFNS